MFFFLFWNPIVAGYYLPTVNFQSHLMYNISSLGGRFKKEIVVDGQSYLLLIRDEGGPPELQVGGQILQAASLLWSRNTYRTETVCKLSCRHKLFETDHEFPAGLLGEVWQHPGVIIQKEASSHHRQKSSCGQMDETESTYEYLKYWKKIKKILVSFSNQPSNFCPQIFLSSVMLLMHNKNGMDYIFKYKCLAFLLCTSWFEDM